MKAITTTLYVCGSLMVAATILGAMDYKSARHEGLFDKLYKEEKPSTGMALVDKQIDLEDYSRGRLTGPPQLMQYLP